MKKVCIFISLLIVILLCLTSCKKTSINNSLSQINFINDSKIKNFIEILSSDNLNINQTMLDDNIAVIQYGAVQSPYTDINYKINIKQNNFPRNLLIPINIDSKHKYLINLKKMFSGISIKNMNMKVDNTPFIINENDSLDIISGKINQVYNITGDDNNTFSLIKCTNGLIISKSEYKNNVATGYFLFLKKYGDNKYKFNSIFVIN